MELKKIKIKNKVLSSSEGYLFVCSESGNEEKKLEIPKRLIIKTDSERIFSRNNKKSEWLILWVDSDFFKDSVVLKKIRRLKISGHIITYGNKRFGINFDNVIDRLYSRNMDTCFYCDVTLNKDNRTTDHIIPRAIIKAYGLNAINDNTVPCCSSCNSEKSNLHPYTFREYVRQRKKVSSRYRTMFKVLNTILINKTDPLC